MSVIHITRNHSLGLEAARVAAGRVADELRSEHSVTAHWEGDRLLVRGSGVRGELDVSDSLVNVKVKLRLFMIPLKWALEKEINEQLDMHLMNGSAP